VGSKTTIAISARMEAFRELLAALHSMLQNGNEIERQEVTLHGPHIIYKILK
jgi:hypothetical protein